MTIDRLVKNSKISCSRFNKVRNYTMCTHCVMDTSVHDIKFNDKGRCNYCNLYKNLESKYPEGKKGFEIARSLAKKIKKANSNSEYDCVVGISGGCDSSFLLYLSVLFGLKPLAVYFDSGWGNEISVNNKCKIVLNKLDCKSDSPDFMKLNPDTENTSCTEMTTNEKIEQCDKSGLVYYKYKCRYQKKPEDCEKEDHDPVS